MQLPRSLFDAELKAFKRTLAASKPNTFTIKGLKFVPTDVKKEKYKIEKDGKSIAAVILLNGDLKVEHFNIENEMIVKATIFDVQAYDRANQFVDNEREFWLTKCAEAVNNYKF